MAEISRMNHCQIGREGPQGDSGEIGEPGTYGEKGFRVSLRCFHYLHFLVDKSLTFFLNISIAFFLWNRAIKVNLA